jgi:hypothetical protein
MSSITFFLSIVPMQVTTHLSDPRWGSEPPRVPEGPPSMFHSVDGRCSRVYSSGTSQGIRHRCFLALMVGALRSTAPAPPRGAAIDIS